MHAETVPHLHHLVIFAPNWLGDAVMSLPAIADVCRASPGASIAIAARPSIAPLFGLVPGIGEVVSPDALRGRGFGAALLLPNSFHAAWCAWRAGIAERWGYSANFRAPLLTRRVAPPPFAHQAECYQHLVRGLGFPSGPLLPRLEVSAASRQSGEQLLLGMGWDGKRPIVALAPGAAYGGAKRWPPESFAAVARALAADGIGAVLVGSAADARTGAEVEKGARLMNTIGQADLPTLAGVLLACRAIVTNDSGAMHFAAALGTKVTAMFGPTNEQATHPIGAAETTVLTHPVWCRPCMLRECPIGHGCMRGITVEAVLSAVRTAL